MEGSNRIHFEHNNFLKNGYAVKIMANCQQDTFYLNNFSGNTFDAGTNGTLSDNVFSGNYWDKYEGYDLDKDGIGDVPYNPVSLYSVIVEKMPYAVMLLRSFAVDLLDRAEKIIPSLVPETIQDKLPKMKIIKA
jgi:nitrous oxidase accessory protein